MRLIERDLFGSEKEGVWIAMTGSKPASPVATLGLGVAWVSDRDWLFQMASPHLGDSAARPAENFTAYRGGYLNPNSYICADPDHPCTLYALTSDTTLYLLILHF